MSVPLSYATPGTIGPARKPISSAALAVFTLLAAWGGTFLGPIAYVALVPLAFLVARKRYKLVALCLLLTPISVSFFTGAGSYALGSAHLKYFGLPGPTFFNLDPDLRCGRSTSGCCGNGSEWMTHAPNNAAVTLLTRLFGPQPGTYTGPYPSESQAKAALAAAMPVSLDALLKDQIDLARRPLKLDAGVGRGLLDGSLLCSYPPFTGEAELAPVIERVGPITATAAHAPCLIVRIPMYEDCARIALIDTATGRPFAFYAEGDAPDRFPPVAWRK